MSRRRLLEVAAAAGLAALVLPSPTLAAGDLAASFGPPDAGAGGGAFDHSAWTALLERHVRRDAQGLDRVDYAAFKADRASLASYLGALEGADVRGLSREEQFAYWANLYNARTIAIVLDHYPVASIRKISLGGTLLSNLTGGPWKAKTSKVAGVELSLDDIEHGILRPLYKDARVHYAVNCASVGCPNVGTAAWTGATLSAGLDKAAADYVNSRRGVRVDGGNIIASSIFDWFGDDFGGEAGVLEHLRKHAAPELATQLASAKAIDDYEYDWSLNDIAR